MGNFKRNFDGWTLYTLAMAGLVSIPAITVGYLAATASIETLIHLVDTVLPGYTQTTLLLMLGVGTGTCLIGIPAAWLVTVYRFPGRRFFEWAMLLPMAMPAYVIANVYVELLEYAGPVQILLRKTFGWRSAGDYWFPEVRSLGGAVVMMTLVLYPYVYILVRTAFLSQSGSVLEVSRAMGKGAWKGFLFVAIPLARPAIALGVALVLMEAVADFGTVELFAVNTFTRGIYSAWDMYDIGAAAQLSVSLLMFVSVLIFLERMSRRKRRYYDTSTFKQVKRVQCGFFSGIFASATCIFPVVLGFILPFGLLSLWAVETFEDTLTDRFLNDATNSVMLACFAALLAVAPATAMAYAVRLRKKKRLMLSARIACLGYAIPGPIVALGVLIPFGAFDNGLDDFMRDEFNISTGLLLSGTVAAVLFSYLVRFLAVSLGTMEAGLAKITQSMEEASRSLGKGVFSTLVNVHLPLLRGSALTAILLVFVDVMKELPATLMLRPPFFDTLATRVFEYQSDQLLRETSLWAVAIVAFGVIPVIILSRSITNSRLS